MIDDTDPLVTAVRTGSREHALVALRDAIAARMTTAPHREFAALARRLERVLADLEGVAPHDDSGDPAAELRKRRFDRRASIAAAAEAQSARVQR
jgi:hypothetical protein